MTEFSGDIRIFLAALGQPEESPEVRAAVAHLGAEPTVSEFTYGPQPERHLEFTEDGVEILLEGGRVDSVFFFVHVDGQPSYRSLGSLVQGLTPRATRAEVRGVLGDPVESSDTYDLYAADDRFVHLEYDGEALRQITATARLVVVDADQPDDGVRLGSADDAPSALTGDITRIISVLGLPLAAIEATGLADGAVRHDAVVDGTSWLYLLTDDGLDLQLREGVLVGVLVHLVREGGTVYPRPATLVDGLDLPTSAAAVRDRFGTPAVSSPTALPGESFDLFHLDDQVSFSVDYLDDRVVSVTVLSAG